jgi:hypothetical protein
LLSVGSSSFIFGPRSCQFEQDVKEAFSFLQIGLEPGSRIKVFRKEGADGEEIFSIVE